MTRSQQWAANLNTITRQTAEQDQALRSGLQQAAPTADQLNAVFSDVREALPQTLANIAIVADLLKRYNKGLEQAAGDPAAGRARSPGGHDLPGRGSAAPGLSINQPPPCLTGFLPASEWRSPGRHHDAAAARGAVLQDPEGLPGATSCAARATIRASTCPASGAATPRSAAATSRTSRWAPTRGTATRTRSCTCPARRRALRSAGQTRLRHPGTVDQQRHQPVARRPSCHREPPSPISDPLTAPGQGTVSCSGQQPNPCIYTPASGPARSTARRAVRSSGPDGVKYSVTNSSNPGDDGWKEMLAPAG